MNYRKILLLTSLITLGAAPVCFANNVSGSTIYATSEDPSVQAATNAVDALFTDRTHTTVSPKTTANSIKEARKLILKAFGKCDTQTLSKLCDTAELLMQKTTVSEDPSVQAATNAVDALFTDRTHTTVSPKTTANSIKEARKLILKAFGKCDTQTLSKLCDTAELLMQKTTVSEDPSVQAATNAVDALFTDRTHTTVSPKTTANSIKEARKLILKAFGKCDTQTLSKLCNIAELLLDTQH